MQYGYLGGRKEEEFGHKLNKKQDLTKPVTNQNIKNDTVPPALIEVWQHVAKG